MDPAAHIWTPHLKPGERVLWSASVSEQLFRAAAQRRLIVRLLIMGVAGVAAFLFGLNFVRDMAHLSAGDTATDLGASLSWPLQIAFAAACLIIAIAQPFRLKLPRPAATHFAVTSQRILAANDNALLDEVAAADIDGLKLGRDLIIHRVKNDAVIAPLIIAHAERLAEAKAAIDSQLLEQTP